jgi:hypothetical protein
MTDVSNYTPRPLSSFISLYNLVFLFLLFIFLFRNHCNWFIIILKVIIKSVLILIIKQKYKGAI